MTLDPWPLRNLYYARAAARGAALPRHEQRRQRRARTGRQCTARLHQGPFDHTATLSRLLSDARSIFLVVWSSAVAEGLGVAAPSQPLLAPHHPWERKLRNRYLSPAKLFSAGA